MGFGDRLKEIGGGLADIFSGPLGLPFDIARAASSDEYNPGFMGVFSAGVDRTTQGLARVGEGTGLSSLGRGIGEATPIDNWFKAFLDEAELVYNTEFQIQQGQAPIGLRQMGVQPGQASIQRAAATPLGAAGALLPGGEPAAQGVFRSWERSRETSPGRALVDNMFGYYQRTPQEQQALRGNGAYNFFTGTIDAASRWFLQPEVIGGKAIKKTRQSWNPSPQKLLERANRATGGKYKVTMKEAAESVTTQEGVRMMQLESGTSSHVYHVTRRSQLGAKGSPDLDPDVEGQLVLDLEPSRPVPEGEDVIDLAEEAAGPTELLRPQDKGLVLHPEDQLEEAQRYARDLYNQNPNDPPVIVRIKADGLPVIFEDFSNPVPGNGRFMTMADRITEDNIDEIIPVGTRDDLPRRTPERRIPTREEIDAGSADSDILRIHNEIEEEVALEVLASEITQAPGDLPTTEAADLIEDLTRSRLEEMGITMDDVNRAAERMPGGSDFLSTPDEAKGVTVDEIFEGMNVDEFLGVASQADERLYRPDGTPIEPGDIVPFEEIADDFLTASRLYGESPVTAEKFLKARARERAARNMDPNQNPQQRVLDNKVTQQALNTMDGMSADEIRRQFFPNHPFGQEMATYLAEAGSYAERRAILGAGMGIRLPEFETIPQIAKTRLELLRREADALANGGVPNEKVLAMLGEENRLANVPAEEAAQIFDEMIRETGKQEEIYRFLDSVSHMMPVDRLSVPMNRRVGAALRKTHFYQDSPLSRPIRSVVEMKPHAWINVDDPMSDIQIVRQLEEARPLGVTAAETQRFRERYMAARTPGEKQHIVLEAEDMLIERAATQANLEPEEFRDLMNASRKGRSTVKSHLESRRYAPDGKDKIRFFDEETGEVVERVMPLLSTQAQNFIPLADVREIIKHTNKARKIKADIGHVPKEIMDGFYRVWKPSVLLRGGWMLRVVSDEQLRILALTGSLVKHLHAISAGKQVRATEVFGKGLTAGQRAADFYGTITLTRPLTALTQRVAKPLSKAAEKLGLVDPEYAKYVRELGIENAVSSRAAFGGPNESSFQDIQSLLGRDESAFLNHLTSKATGQWQTVAKGDRLYGSAWLRALNEQMGRDPLVQNILETILSNYGEPGVWMDDVYRNAKAYLKNTPEGQAISERMPWRSTDPDKWIEDVVETISYYTSEFDENLLRGMKDRNLTSKSLEGIDEALRPETVHAEIIDQTLGTSVVTEFFRDFIANGFDVMGRLPTDTLSRQPLFKQLYAGRMTRLERMLKDQGEELTEEAIQRMSTSARAYAIEETRRYLYDLAEVSRFGHAARFFFPFYSAWQEVLKVWGGLAAADPSIIGRGVQLWKSPNRAGMVVTDDEGEEYLQFRLSEQTQDNLGLTGWSRYLATGGIRVGKTSFNLVLNSPLPGAGPLIQYPIAESVKRQPNLEESLRFMLPFGVPTDSTQILASPIVRQFMGEIKGAEGERSYQRAFTDAITWMDNQYRIGERSVPPTLDEAHDIARKIRTFRLFSRLASPAQPIFDSPLKPYMDIYRDLIENVGPEQADEVFLNEFGQEFFAVTLSRTVSETGIPPTVEAEMARRSYENLIERHPEYGRLIIGDDAAIGEFSSAAYAAQMGRQVDPDDPFSPIERTVRPVELDPDTGTIVEVDTRLGWQEYIQAMDTLEVERKRRGLPNLRVSEAEDLANAKRSVTQFIAQKYPSWWRSFNQRDDLKWDSRVSAFREIANSPAAEDRPDLNGIVDYLTIRDQVVQELNRRRMMGGSSTLEAMSNQDLLLAWETAVASVLEDNIAFAPIYFRYLEGDPVAIRGGG